VKGCIKRAVNIPHLRPDTLNPCILPKPNRAAVGGETAAENKGEMAGNVLHHLVPSRIERVLKEAPWYEPLAHDTKAYTL
jgi:hypothetical protein